MKKLVVIFLVLSLLSGICLHVSAAQLDAQTSILSDVGNCSGFDADMALLGAESIVENVSAAFLYDIGSDTLMYAHNPDVQTSPSSLVKIMTALIAVERGELQQLVTVSAGAVESIPAGAVSADLVEGEQLTLNDLLHCMMVGSANDAAAVIAEYIGGTQGAFVQEMNTRAVELGCTATNFVNPHGLHDDQQYSTVRDIARILAEAMKHDAFQTAFSAEQYTVPATNKSNARDFTTGNYLMNVNADNVEVYYDERVTGGRTGVANDGTRCLAASAESNGLHLISVLVGAESEIEDDGYTVRIFGSFREMTALLDAGFNGYKSVRILYAGQALSQQSVLNGSNDVVLGPQTDISAVLPADVSIEDLAFKLKLLQDFKAPVELGQRAAEIEVWYGNLCIAKTELFAMNQVASVNVGQDNVSGSLIDRNLLIVLWIVIAIVVGIALLIFGIITVRQLRILSRRKHGKKYSRNRRRSR